MHVLKSDSGDVPVIIPNLIEGYPRYMPDLAVGMSLLLSCPSSFLAPKIYSCSLPHQSATVSSSEETAPENVYGFWFAPRDICPWEFEGRDDLHGIGYSGMEDREVLGRRETTRALYGMKGEVCWRREGRGGS